MTEEERHDRSHATAEEEIDTILYDIFSDQERACRAVVLIKILHKEFMAMDDVEDVADIADALVDLVLTRMTSDRQLLNSVGTA